MNRKSIRERFKQIDDFERMELVAHYEPNKMLTQHLLEIWSDMVMEIYPNKVCVNRFENPTLFITKIGARGCYSKCV